MSNKLLTSSSIGAVAGLIAFSPTNTSAQGILKGDTAGVGSVNHTFMIIMSTFLQKK